MMMLHCRVLLANTFKQRAKPCTVIALASSASTRFSNPRNPWPRQCESGREKRIMTYLVARFDDLASLCSIWTSPMKKSSWISSWSITQRMWLSICTSLVSSARIAKNFASSIEFDIRLTTQFLIRKLHSFTISCDMLGSSHVLTHFTSKYPKKINFRSATDIRFVSYVCAHFCFGYLAFFLHFFATLALKKSGGGGKIGQPPGLKPGGGRPLCPPPRLLRRSV